MALFMERNCLDGNHILAFTMRLELMSSLYSLGLPISESAIEQMKARVEMTDEDFKIAAAEEAVCWSPVLRTMSSGKQEDTVANP